jgi:hypothetical protein
MRALFIFGLLCISVSVMTSCGGGKKNSSDTDSTSRAGTDTALNAEKNRNYLLGTWKDDFSKLNLRLVIENVKDSEVTGFDMHKEQKHSFSGSYEDKDDFFLLSLKEEGDDQGNGEFRFTINKKSLKAEGQWSSYDGKVTLPFSLNKISSENMLTIKGEHVNMRKQPNTDAEVIMILDGGTECEILEKGKKEKIDGKTSNWYKIHYKEKDGWIFGSLATVKKNSKK